MCVCRDVTAVWNGASFFVFAVFVAFGLSAGLWRYKKIIYDAHK